MARKKPPVTSSRRRQDRKAGKGAASKPSPRQTAAGGRGAQQGPLKPGTRTSGSGMVNANKPYMQRIQAKATELRKQIQRGKRPTGQRATTLPNSARAGRNLIREGAQRMRTPGDSGQVRAAAQRGQEIRKAAQATRGARAALGRMGGTLARARMMRGPASAAAAIAADAALGPMATKAGKALGRGPLRALGRKIDDALPGVNSRDEARRRRAQAAAKGSSSSFKGARDAAMKKASAIKGSPVVGPRKAKAGSAAKSFDSAFAAARKSGKSTFTWRGKKYNTKQKGEK